MRAHRPGYLEGGISQKKTCYEYRDVGCKAAKQFYNYHGGCLDCPLPVCLEDTTAPSRQWMTKRRRREIVLEMIEHMNVKEIAERLGCHVRTVRRALVLEEASA